MFTLSQALQTPPVNSLGLNLLSSINMSSTHLTRIAMAIAALALAACSSTKLAETADVTGKAVAAPATPAAAQSAVAPVVADHLNPNSLISKERSVFFDFDQFVIKANDGPLIERQGKYLASKQSLAIRVEGNADERGGREYNLALGQKRADAVVRALKVYGVGEKQLEAVSFGSEKPAMQGHDEAAWAQNRRVDLAYPNK
jgi:peptidoglycan-associated lipoprotein